MTAIAAGSAPVLSVSNVGGQTTLGGTPQNPIIGLPDIGTANTYANPVSITTDTWGRVTGVTPGDVAPLYTYQVKQGRYFSGGGGVVYERIQFNLGDSLIAVLSTAKTAGFLTCSLPFSFSIASPGAFTIKVALGTDVYTPTFDGTPTDYSITLASLNPYPLFSPSGISLSVPLSAIATPSTAPSYLTVFINNNTTTPFIGSFASTLLVNVSLTNLLN